METRRDSRSPAPDADKAFACESIVVTCEDNSTYLLSFLYLEHHTLENIPFYVFLSDQLLTPLNGNLNLSAEP